MEDMFTMATTAIENLPLEEQLPPDVVGSYHEARDIPCFKILVQKEDNAPQATIGLVIKSDIAQPLSLLH